MGFVSLIIFISEKELETLLNAAFSAQLTTILTTNNWKEKGKKLEKY